VLLFRRESKASASAATTEIDDFSGTEKKKTGQEERKKLHRCNGFVAARKLSVPCHLLCKGIEAEPGRGYLKQGVGPSQAVACPMGLEHHLS